MLLKSFSRVIILPLRCCLVPPHSGFALLSWSSQPSRISVSIWRKSKKQSESFWKHGNNHGFNCLLAKLHLRIECCIGLMFTYSICIGLFLHLKFTEFLLGHGCLLGDHFFLLGIVIKVRYWMLYFAVIVVFLYLQNRRYSFATGIASWLFVYLFVYLFIIGYYKE